MTTAEEWNIKHPIGTVVNAWPGTRDGAGLRTKTRSLAWTLGSGDPVVAVEGYPGGIALTHVEPVNGHKRLIALADHLDSSLAYDLLRLAAADSEAHRFKEVSDALQRSEDLVRELRRQLASLERQNERLRARMAAHA